MSKSRDNHLVKRQTLSLCPGEILTPRVTRVAGQSVKKEGNRQKWEQILPFLKVAQKVWTFHWFQMKQKSLSWNYREREDVSHSPLNSVHTSTIKNRDREQGWTRFTVNWDRKQVRMAFCLALPSFAMKGFQSSNYKSKLKLFCESAFEGAAILPFKAFPQPDS